MLLEVFCSVFNQFVFLLLSFEGLVFFLKKTYFVFNSFFSYVICKYILPVCHLSVQAPESASCKQ